VPDDVHTLGWWQYGAAAGSTQGTVVIDGQVDSAGHGGVLWTLIEGADSVVTQRTGARSKVSVMLSPGCLICQ